MGNSGNPIFQIHLKTYSQQLCQAATSNRADDHRLGHKAGARLSGSQVSFVPTNLKNK